MRLALQQREQLGSKAYSTPPAAPKTSAMNERESKKGHSQKPFRHDGNWIKLSRSPETTELLRDPLAFALLAHISVRARWRNTRNNTDGLAPGEALIGDYEECGMSRREYRTRVDRLVKWGLIAIRTTSKGTIARLISTAVFDINEQPNNYLTSERHAKNDHQSGQHNFIGKNYLERPTEGPSRGHQTAITRPLTNNERMKEQKNDDTRTPEPANAAESQAMSTSSSISGWEEAKKHPYWPQFVKYCRDLGGIPTLKGFRTWLRSQPPIKPKPASQRKVAPDPSAPKLSDTEREAVVAKFKADNENAGLQRKRPNGKAPLCRERLDGFRYNRKAEAQPGGGANRKDRYI